jgi:hypothetical protein
LCPLEVVLEPSQVVAPSILHRSIERTVKSRMKELEEGAKRAEEAKVKTEREYTALRDGLRYGRP